MFSKKRGSDKVCAIVLAAGNGTRMAAEIKKQFIEINGKPLIYYSLFELSKSQLIGEIILVTSKEDIVAMQDIVKTFELHKVAKIVSGGETRQDSTYNGLKEVDSKYEYVLIHDGARPLVNVNDVDNVINDAFEYGAATLGVMVKDTIKTVDKDMFSTKTLNRETLAAIQTPQVIKKSILTEGYKYAKDKVFTDDTSIVENIGVKVKITLGSYSNIKITTPDDLIYLKGMGLE